MTHRVVAVEPYGSSIRLTLKADANPAPDAETYDVTEVKRVVSTLPWLGWLFAPADGMLALIIGAVFIGCLVDRGVRAAPSAPRDAARRQLTLQVRFSPRHGVRFGIAVTRYGSASQVAVIEREPRSR